VKKEPRLALVADDFMKMHQDLIMGAYKNLKMGGRMILETHPDKAKDLLQMGEGLGFQATIQKDLSNKDRFVIFQK
jgi:release factor glutamine methyltransferase